FFQAEDGIRDFHVTGVQTCALPIYGCFKFRPRQVLAFYFFAQQFIAVSQCMDNAFFTDIFNPRWQPCFCSGDVSNTATHQTTAKDTDMLYWSRFGITSTGFLLHFCGGEENLPELS